jgi:predicted nuclease of restriction endonuclease-like (RecB) superfamily
VLLKACPDLMIVGATFESRSRTGPPKEENLSLIRGCRQGQAVGETSPPMPTPAVAGVPTPAILARVLPDQRLLADLRQMIRSTREQVSRAVDAGLVALYWQAGRRIRKNILKDKRAEYGKVIVATLSQQLTIEFGAGWSRANMARMVQFAERFPNAEIVATLSRQLGWSHFKELIPTDDALKRDFYAELCRAERWSVRALRQKIQSMLFERTALSKKPAKLVAQELKQLREEDKVTPDLVFRDPYVLDFLGLKDTYAEKDIEAAILREMEAFLLELGVGFAFVARQKRMAIGGRDHHLDLLFYHRGLCRLVALDLKIGDFAPADKAQMELYLAWLRENEQQPREASPLGLILCAGKDDETVRLLDLDQGDIRVASYWTKLVPRAALAWKLHDATRLARARLASTLADRCL